MRFATVAVLVIAAAAGAHAGNCGANQYVSGGVCTQCPPGTIRPLSVTSGAAGDDTTAGDTACTMCAADYYVSGGTCVMCADPLVNPLNSASEGDTFANGDSECHAKCESMTCPMGWVSPGTGFNPNYVCTGTTCNPNECCFYTCAVSKANGNAPTGDSNTDTGFDCFTSEKFPSQANMYNTDACTDSSGAQATCSKDICCSLTCGDTTAGDNVNQEVDCSSLNQGTSNDFVLSPVKRCGSSGQNADAPNCDASTCCVDTRSGGDGDGDSSASAIEASGIAAAAAVVAYAL